LIFDFSAIDIFACLYRVLPHFSFSLHFFLYLSPPLLIFSFENRPGLFQAACQWHQLDHMQTICTSLQTDNHTNTPSLNFSGRVHSPTPNQQRQSTEGKLLRMHCGLIKTAHIIKPLS